MLTQIRDRATGWIAWVIVILITIPFALWGIQSYFEGANEIPVATIDDAEISAYDYQNELARQRQALMQRLGRSFDPALLDSLGIKEQVLAGLINDQLLQSYTQDKNFRMSDDQLSSLITTNNVFHEEGVFSQRQYLQILSANNMTPQSFEASQRQQGVILQLQSGLIESSFTLDSELNRLLSLETQTRQTEYGKIPGNKFESEFEITTEEIQEYYSENIDNYQTPERMKVEFIELSVDSLMETIEPGEAELESIFRENNGRYKTAESRRASHILFNVSGSASEEDKESTRQAAELVLAQAIDGVDFAELASVHSDDPGSGNNGGDLGVITRGQMVKPFEDAVFSMAEGDIEGLIESKFGFHIIKLTELIPERQQTLEEVREQIIAEARKVEAENLFAELGESFQNLVFEDPENLNTAADELNLTVQVSDWFTQASGSGIANEPEVRRAAFSEEVLNEDLVSPAIEIGFDRLIAVKKQSHEPQSPVGIKELEETIEQTLKSIKSREKVRKTGSELVESVSQSALSREQWEQFKAENQLVVQELADQRGNIPPDLIELGDAVFAQKPPQEGEVQLGGVALRNGDYMIYGLIDVQQGNKDHVDEALKNRMTQRLQNRGGGSSFQHFSDLLRSLAAIEIDEGQL